MPRLTKIYTRTGDDGTTALGSGERVPKCAERVVAYGAIDELNAQLGVVLAANPVVDLVEPLRQMQNELFSVGAGLCTPESARPKAAGPRIQAQHVRELEKLLDRLNESLKPLKSFVLPGGDPAAAHLHFARTVCRRAERATVRLAQDEPVGEHLLAYLNRLSDVLFVMARYQNKQAGADEPVWDSRA